MNKYYCPYCHIEMIPSTQEENCIQKYKCPNCDFSDLYDSLPIEKWEEGMDKIVKNIRNNIEEHMNILKGGK